MDTSCYHAYAGDDMHDYSTYFYRDVALDIIEAQDVNTPMFLYLAFQAVHAPFSDIHEFISGIPRSYLADDIYDAIRQNVTGRKARQYAMTLSLLDEAVGDIVDKLEERDMMDNTYIIFASDNGGCYMGGGMSGPLRGTKGTLLEGGTKVDAFIYSPTLLPDAAIGATFAPLMHVSDWFPTILDMVNINSFEPETNYELDGYSQYDTFSDPQSSGNREYVLYNAYSNVTDLLGEKDKVFAIRNSQFKLIGYYDGGDFSEWYEHDSAIDDDEDLHDLVDCSQSSAMTGDFQYALFDLINDPYETTDLYGSEEQEHLLAKVALTKQLNLYKDNARRNNLPLMKNDAKAEQFFKEAGNYIVPYKDIIKLRESTSLVPGVDYPEWCGSTETRWLLFG